MTPLFEACHCNTVPGRAESLWKAGLGLTSRACDGTRDQSAATAMAGSHGADTSHDPFPLSSTLPIVTEPRVSEGTSHPF